MLRTLVAYVSTGLVFVVVDAIWESLGDEASAALRSFAAAQLKELLVWTARQQPAHEQPRLVHSHCMTLTTLMVYENVFRWLVIRGLVEASTFYSREYDWLRHSWIPPGWQWIDPKKEADGKEVEVNLGTETVSDIILSQGQDPKVKLERRAKELKYIKELESKYGVEMSTKTQVREVNQDD